MIGEPPPWWFILLMKLDHLRKTVRSALNLVGYRIKAMHTGLTVAEKERAIGEMLFLGHRARAREGMLDLLAAYAGEKQLETSRLGFLWYLLQAVGFSQAGDILAERLEHNAEQDSAVLECGLIPDGRRERELWFATIHFHYLALLLIADTRSLQAETENERTAFEALATGYRNQLYEWQKKSPRLGGNISDRTWAFFDYPAPFASRRGEPHPMVSETRTVTGWEAELILPLMEVSTLAKARDYSRALRKLEEATIAVANDLPSDKRAELDTVRMDLIAARHLAALDQDQ